ncbi:hypothetical protein [Luteococcus peritonei]|uniref:Uncharacterized protein n=1 Tax=Luteococcus peritonei TaxID=88874 RepID=A0ABW4RVH5_9ACTN
MKQSTALGLIALILCLMGVWFAWQGLQVTIWRIRFMMPAFFAGILVGVIGTLGLSGGRD